MDMCQSVKLLSLDFLQQLQHVRWRFTRLIKGVGFPKTTCFIVSLRYPPPSLRGFNLPRVWAVRVYLGVQIAMCHIASLLQIEIRNHLARFEAQDVEAP